MQKWSSKSESTRKTEQNKSCWKFLTMVKVNGQRSKSTVRVNCQRMTCADVAVWRHLGLTWQEEKRSRRVWCVWRVSECGLARGGRVAGTDGAWQCMERVFVRQKLQPALGGACDAVSGRSWLGFARDCLFYLSMPFFWQLNAQNVDIWVLQVLWSWRRWLASDSDDWMKARATEERRRCPQEPESHRNGSDTMLTI